MMFVMSLKMKHREKVNVIVNVFFRDSFSDRSEEELA